MCCTIVNIPETLNALEPMSRASLRKKDMDEFRPGDDREGEGDDGVESEGEGEGMIRSMIMMPLDLYNPGCCQT
jgi:hypothetical protein